MARPPAYQNYVGDMHADIKYQCMTWEERGIYRHLLDVQWIEGSIPSDPKLLARILKMEPSKVADVWEHIKGCFPIKARGGGVQNKRMEKERRARSVFLERQSERGKAGAKALWDKMKDVTSMPVPCRSPCRKHDSSSSSSSSSSLPLTSSRSNINITPSRSMSDFQSDSLPRSVKIFIQEYQEEWNKLSQETGGIISKTNAPSGARIKKIKSRLCEQFFRDHWKEAIAYIKADPFYRGNGKQGWIVTSEYLLRNEENVHRVVERGRAFQAREKKQEEKTVSEGGDMYDLKWAREQDRKQLEKENEEMREWNRKCAEERQALIEKEKKEEASDK